MDSRFFTVDQIKAENFKGLENFEADLKNSSVILFGSEAVGKTNVYMLVNSIKKLPSAVLTKGKESGTGEISVSKGDTNYKFCFTFTEDGKHKLTTYVDGEAKPVTKARQAYLLEELIAPSIDIDQLINTTGQKQTEIIKQALKIDTTTEEAFYKQHYDARTLIKRDLTNSPKPTEVKEVKEVVLNDLLKEQDDITKYNQEQDAKQRVLNYYLGISKKLDAAISEPTSESYLEYIATTTNINKDIIKYITGRLKDLNQPLEYKDSIGVSEKIRNAQTTNEQALSYKTYLSDLKKHNDLLKKVDDADVKVKDARNTLVSKMNSIEIPIEGLEFKVDMTEAGSLKTELMYNGLPFNDESINSSKKLAIAAKLQMQMFKEGNLGVFHCNASMMSSSTVKELSEECSKLGLQCLFEITAREDNKSLTVESIL